MAASEALAECARWSTPGTDSVIDGKYRLRRLVAMGGMGVVWNARHIPLGIDVAIKFTCAAHQSADPTAARRLLNEGRLLASLRHPNLVGVHDVGWTDAGEAYLVMDWLEGQDLGCGLQRGPFTPVQACRILLPVLQGLQAAHQLQIVHRDVKPENIFVAVEQGTTRPKLLDFGAALVLDCAQDLRLTRPGTIIGSPWYMSPEQARGRHDVDPRSDLWSFCATLYECVAGRPPIVAEDYESQLRAIAEQPPDPLTLACDGAAELVSIIETGLQKDPARRWQTATQLGQRLASWLLDRGVDEDVCNQALGSMWSAARRRSISVELRRDVEGTPRARGHCDADAPTPVAASRPAGGSERLPSFVAFAAALCLTLLVVAPSILEQAVGRDSQPTASTSSPHPVSVAPLVPLRAQDWTSGGSSSTTTHVGIASAPPRELPPDDAERPERGDDPSISIQHGADAARAPTAAASSDDEPATESRTTTQHGLPVDEYPAPPRSPSQAPGALRVNNELPATVDSVWGF